MQKYLSLLLVICLLLSIGGCARISSDIEDTEPDNSDAAKSDSLPTAELGPAAWPTDVWSTSSPEQQGINSALLTAADKRITDNYPNVYSLLVVRHGYLVYEKYYQGMDENSANPIYSVTKSVMSALTGIAVRNGLIENLDQKVSQFLPEHFTQIDDARKNDITIKNVLTMTGGLESIDDNYFAYFSSADWLDYVLAKPLTDAPGDKFSYNTGLTHFLSAIITETAGMSTKKFADTYLFDKIGIKVDSWYTDNKEYYAGGFGIEMKPVDMAKFGYLYLNNGSWDGNQIISADWIEKSAHMQVKTADNSDYGYLFWSQTFLDTVQNKEHFIYYASGSGGQYIMVIPDLDMVAVVTADDDYPSNDGTNTFDILTDYVIPAAE